MLLQIPCVIYFGKLIQNTENTTSDENNKDLIFLGKVQNDMDFVGKLDTRPTQTNENMISCGEGKNRSKSVENSRLIKESKVNSNSQIEKNNQIKSNDDNDDFLTMCSSALNKFVMLTFLCTIQKYDMNKKNECDKKLIRRI